VVNVVVVLYDDVIERWVTAVMLAVVPSMDAVELAAAVAVLAPAVEFAAVVVVK